MKPFLLAGVALAALSILAAPALADVSVCDRALRIAETDIGYSGGLEPSLERFYRSDSSHAGLFGRGWGSRYETRLAAQADGNILVYENGCGSVVTFHPVQDRPGQWETKGCGPQRITQTPTGFERQMIGGNAETFSTDGRLLRVTDANGNWIRVGYEQERVAAITDNFGRALAFAYGPDGRLERVSGDDGRVARYRFDAEGRLIGATEPDGGERRYGYGQDGLLASEDAPDGGKIAATYDSGGLTSLAQGGALRRFGGAEGEGWREVWEATEDSEGHRLGITRRVQLFRVDERGQSRRWRELATRDGRSIDTEFNDIGKPAIIRDGNGLGGGFRYDAQGRLVHKESKDETVDMTYDAATGKVSRVERRTPTSRTWSAFDYDSRGNLSAARDSAGRKALLGHDQFGRISDVTERDRRLSFTYNKDSRPTSVTLRGGGTIRVEYDAKGEIASVQSDGGAAMALKVTKTFQSLLELVRPANVRIGL